MTLCWIKTHPAVPYPTVCLPVCGSKLVTRPQNHASSSGHSTRSSRPTSCSGASHSSTCARERQQLHNKTR